MDTPGNTGRPIPVFIFCSLLAQLEDDIQAKFNEAVATAREQLGALYEKAKIELGEEKAAIVEVQMLMLDDLDYLEGVAAAIEGGAAAADAEESQYWQPG